MKIKINDNWGIKSDKFQYNLCKIRNIKKDGEIKEQFDGIKHSYRTIGDALEGYYEHKLKIEDNITSLEDLIDLHGKILSEIKELNNKLNIEVEVNK